MVGSPDRITHCPNNYLAYRRDVITPLYSHDTLNREQERMLTVAIREADKVRKQILDGSICSSTETDAIIGEGEKATAFFVVKNIKWVDRIARGYQGRCGTLQLEDLISEGNFGIIRATKTYDPEQGNRFLTYATPWIHQTIRRAIVTQGSMIRHPEYLVYQINRIKKVQERLSFELGRSPITEEIATRLGIDQDKVSELIELDRVKETASLDIGVGEKKDISLVELIPDNSQDLSDQVATRDYEVAVHEMLGFLGERERKVIELRFGLHDGTVWTLQKVADEILVTRQRVDQLEKAALVKLRRLAQTKRLRGYL